MASRITVVPAYGRDYRNKAQIEADWAAGKDFTINDMSSRWDGSKINKEDAEGAGIREVNVRYQQMRKVHVIKVGSNLRSAMIHVAADLPVGDPVRKELIAALQAKTAKSLTLTFHADPGHGWLEVPKALLKELGIAGEISRYSMQKGQVAYLEEDMDAGTFLQAAEKAGYHVQTREKYEDGESFVRRLPGYRR